MTYLVAPRAIAEPLADDLLGQSPLEAGAFCLLHAGPFGRLFLGRRLDDEEWVAQSEGQIQPSGRSISAAVSAAQGEGCGIGFIHTHPFSEERPHLSRIDVKTSLRLGQVFADLLDGPFASLVLAPGGWTGVHYVDGELAEIETIALVGRQLELHRAGRPATASDRALDDRQQRALGHSAAKSIRSLRVAVIGAGGIGSPAAEILARMGVAQIKLIDHDVLDTPSNARRVFGTTLEDFDHQPPLAKAVAVAQGLERLQLGTAIDPIVGDIRDQAILSELADVDAVINGTDTHSSRAVLAEQCMRMLLPLIDLGARAGQLSDGSLDALLFERRIQLPDGPCLWCWGKLDPERIRLELMPEEERKQLEREGYVAGLGGPEPSLGALTAGAAAAGVAALAGLLGRRFRDAPLGSSVDLLSLEAIPFALQEPDPECVCRFWRR